MNTFIPHFARRMGMTPHARHKVGCVLMITVAFCSGVALPQDSQGDKSDWTWLRTEGTAALVLEPAPLKGVKHWVLESPRHRGAILCLVVSPDGIRAATGGTDAVVRIWNLETGTLEKALAGHRYHLYSMDWSPDGTMLATHAWGDGKLIVWDVATGAMKKEFDQPLQMRSLRWSRDSRRLAGCTLGSGRVNLVEQLSDLRVLTEIGQPLASLDWSPDGTRLAVAAYGGATASLLDASTGKSVTALELENDDSIAMLRFSPQGGTLATANSRAASLWDAGTGKRIATITTPVADLVWSPDGKRLATISTAGVKLWNGSDGKPAGGLPATGTLIDWNATTGRIVVATADRVQVWAADGKEAVLSIDAGGSAAPVFQAGKPVVTGVGTNVLSLQDPVSFKRIGRLEGHAKPVTTAVWSLDGKRFASASEDGAVRIWDVKKGETLHECGGHKGRITCLEWSADGKSLASAGYDKTVRIWSAEGEAQATLEGHTSWVEALAWAPNGKQLVTGGRDQSLVIWDTVKMAEAKRIAGTVPITALAWSATKGVPAVAVGLQDGGIRVVNPANGEIMAALVTGNTTNWFKTSSLAWMPGNRPRLLASRYYLTQLWDVSQGKTFQRQIVPGGASAVFPTAGGSLAVARSDDRTVRFWDPVSGTLRGVLLDEGGTLVGISTGGDVKYDPEANPGLIAIVETESGQQTIPLDELAKTYGWKNNAKVLKLPTRN
jgi:WD40 repeat protein